MDYYGVRCKRCGKYSGTAIKDIKTKIFTCAYCRKRLKLKKTNEFGLTTSISGPYAQNEIAIAVAELNKRRVKSND